MKRKHPITTCEKLVCSEQRLQQHLFYISVIHFCLHNVSGCSHFCCCSVFSPPCMLGSWLRRPSLLMALISGTVTMTVVMVELAIAPVTKIMILMISCSYSYFWIQDCRFKFCDQMDREADWPMGGRWGERLFRQWLWQVSRYGYEYGK